MNESQKPIPMVTTRRRLARLATDRGLPAVSLMLAVLACGGDSRQVVLDPIVAPKDLPMDDLELSIHWSLGLALAQENEYAAAWPHVVTVLEVRDDSWPIHLAAAQICLYWSLDYECVREHATRALQLDPDNPRAHLYLGQAAQDSGDLSGAIVHYRTGLALRPSESGIAILLANLLDQQGQREQAITVLQESLRHRHRDGRVMLHLAVLVESTDPDYAERLYTNAAYLYEDPLIAYRHLLRFYQRQGRTQEAEDLRQTMDQMGGGPRQMRPIR